MSTTTTSSSVVRWGIVGLGDVTKVKSGPPFWKCHGSELVAVMRRTPGKASEFAAKVLNASGTKCVGYESLQEFLEHPNLDAIYISTRPGTHLEVGKQVAAAGKACYVEKPVGRCAEETIELDKVFREAGLPLYTAYISRAYERTQALKQLLQDDVIGEKLERIQYTLRGSGGARGMDGKGVLPWRLDPESSGGGLLLDVGCHVLDRIDYLCGPLEQLQGTAENRNTQKIPVEDFCHLSASIGKSSRASMRNGYEGATVECTWDFESNESEIDELVFVGSNGSLKMAGMSPDGPIRILGTDGTVRRELSFDKPEHTAQRLIQAVTDDLLRKKNNNKNARPDFLSFADNAIRTQKVIDEILEEYYGGREIGYCDRKGSWPGQTAESKYFKEQSMN
jgi:1,5-anhydro-D-fructose reductase (1,5-anhydro-D-mannitol-forming)